MWMPENVQQCGGVGWLDSETQQLLQHRTVAAHVVKALLHDGVCFPVSMRGMQLLDGAGGM